MACHIVQVKQDWSNNTSEVRVEGLLKNKTTDVIRHDPVNIGRWITGSAAFQDSDWNIYILPVKFAPNNIEIFISHSFTLKHNSDGTRDVHFIFKYGKTDLPSFPDYQTVEGTLTLDRIPLRPTKPGQPQFSSEAPTTLLVSWTAPTDDGGNAITDYILRRYDGATTNGTHLDSSSNTLSRRITGLTPGATYTFTVVAKNASQGAANGFSPESDPNTITTVSGGNVKYTGTWHKAIPYVRHLGVWKQAIPYVRSGGTWDKTG